jgi:hypothetical protein
MANIAWDKHIKNKFIDYYSVIKKNEIMSFAGKWMKLEIMLR